MGRESHNYGEVIAPLLAGIVVAPSNGPFSRPMNDNVRRDIKAGETLVFENPTGAVIKRTYQKDHCIHCFKYVSSN